MRRRGGNRREQAEVRGNTILKRLTWVFGPANASLSAAQRLVLAYVAYRDSGDGCSAAIPRIARETGLSPATVKRAVRELQEGEVLARDGSVTPMAGGPRLQLERRDGSTSVRSLRRPDRGGLTVSPPQAHSEPPGGSPRAPHRITGGSLRAPNDELEDERARHAPTPPPGGRAAPPIEPDDPRQLGLPMVGVVEPDWRRVTIARVRAELGRTGSAP